MATAHSPEISTLSISSGFSPIAYARCSTNCSKRGTVTVTDKIYERFVIQLRIMYPTVSESWESTAANSLQAMTGFLDLQELLKNGSANEVIIACTAIGCLQLTNAAKELVIEMIKPLSSDWRYSDYSYSRFQCEDNERAMKVSDAACTAIKCLMQD